MTSHSDIQESRRVIEERSSSSQSEEYDDNDDELTHKRTYSRGNEGY